MVKVSRNQLFAIPERHDQWPRNLHYRIMNVLMRGFDRYF